MTDSPSPMFFLIEGDEWVICKYGCWHQLPATILQLEEDGKVRDSIIAPWPEEELSLHSKVDAVPS